MNLTKFDLPEGLGYQDLVNDFSKHLSGVFDDYFKKLPINNLEIFCRAQVNKETKDYLEKLLYSSYISELYKEDNIKTLYNMMMGAYHAMEGQENVQVQRRKSIDMYFRNKSINELIKDYCVLVDKTEDDYPFLVPSFMNEHILAKVDKTVSLQSIESLFKDIENASLCVSIEKKLSIKLFATNEA